MTNQVHAELRCWLIGACAAAFLCLMAFEPCAAALIYVGEAHIGPYTVKKNFEVYSTCFVGGLFNKCSDSIKGVLPAGGTKTYTQAAGTSDIGVIVKEPSSIDIMASVAGGHVEPLGDVLFSLNGVLAATIPSLFDTTSSDNLVGLVDMGAYLRGGGAFSFDPSHIQTFPFINGVSSALPGFTLALTANLLALPGDVFQWVDGSGPQLIGGAGATLFAGTASALGQISVNAIPATPLPATWMLMLAGLVVGWVAIRKRATALDNAFESASPHQLKRLLRDGL